MIHPGLASLKHWGREEYAAGYRARFSVIPNSETAHHCWRCGRKDADTEAIESARHNQALTKGMKDHFEDTCLELSRIDVRLSVLKGKTSVPAYNGDYQDMNSLVNATRVRRSLPGFQVLNRPWTPSQDEVYFPGV